MENTLENKCKFFAQYWGQQVVQHKGPVDALFKIDSIGDETEYNLVLKSLQRLTEEEVIKFVNIRTDIHKNIQKNYSNSKRVYFTSEYGSSKRRRGHSYGIDFGEKMTIEQIDYLRSKGYALPFNGCSVETMIQYGWVKVY